MNSIVTYSIWGFASLVLFSTLINFNLLLDIANHQYYWEYAVIIIFFLSAIVGFIGVLRFKIWGFINIYINIIVATFISISIIPFRLMNFRLTGNVAGKIVIGNLVILLVVLALNILKSMVLKKTKHNEQEY